MFSAGQPVSCVLCSRPSAKPALSLANWGGWETPVSTAGQPVRLVYFIMYRQKAGREALTWHLGRCFCCFSGRRKQGSGRYAGILLAAFALGSELEGKALYIVVVNGVDFGFIRVSQAAREPLKAMSPP